MKKITSIVLAVLLTLSMVSQSSFAAMPSEVMPLWDYTDRVAIEFGFYGSVGEIAINVIGAVNTTFIEAVIVIYRIDGGRYSLVDSIYDSTTGSALDVVSEFDGVNGGEYMAEIVITAYQGDIGEDIEFVKYAICP